jgi:phenylacetate-CoA ligase
MSLGIMLQGFSNLIIRRYIGPFWYRRAWLNKTQWFSKEELTKLQFVLLKRIISHAEHYVPYYQALMKKQGFSAADIHSLSDINHFPILTKQHVIEAGDALLSRAYPRFLLRHALTGGTTGTPLHIYRSPVSIGTEHAFVRRQWDWAGLGFKDNCAYCKGRIIDNERNYIYDPFMKELHLSTYQLNIESAKRYLAIVKEFGCKGLVGYPSSIFILAKAKMMTGIKLPIKSILLTSETLNSDVREYIANAFGVNVYDFYGSAERACYIFTCEKGCYHIQDEYGYTELLPVKNGGHKIVATGFWNYAMPLIRYDTGDTLEMSDGICKCGRNFPIVKRISGREGDYIKTPSGKTFGISILTHMFHVVCGIDCFAESQIVQEKIDHLNIKYIPSKFFRVELIEDYVRQLQKYIGEDMKISFVQVDNIEKTSSGKHKFVISHISE